MERRARGGGVIRAEAAYERGYITMSGPPGTVVPHGAAILRCTNGASRAYAVRWPWWRRLLVWAGAERYALMVTPDGNVTVHVVAVKRGRVP